MDIAPCCRGEWEKNILSFVGIELSFLKLGSVLVGFRGGGVKFFVKANIAKLLFLKSTVSFTL